MVNRSLSKALSIASNIVREFVKQRPQGSKPGVPTARRPRAAGTAGSGQASGRGHARDRGHAGERGQTDAYAGDYVGVPPMSYAPVNDDLADPGEVVWTWVPYQEDHSQGKDRPVLVIGRNAGLLLALQLTSQDHDRDAEQEASQGRFWIEVGTGEWDRERRPSEARVDRILQLDPSGMRRIGAVLAESVFAEVERRAR